MDLARVAVGFGVIFVVLLALLLALWSAQRGLLYFPDDRAVPPASSVLANAEDVAFSTEDGLRLRGWFVPAREASAAVLVLNGNAGNRSDRASVAAALSREGLAVLLFDYRGYGGNPGSPTETGLLRDARAARAYLATRSGEARIAYFGESLGAAVAVALAGPATGERPVRGVGLPELVRQRCLEADERRARALVGLRADQAVAGEDPPDRRDRGDPLGPAAQVVGDGLGAGVMTSFRERSPKREDGLLDLRAMLVRARVRSRGCAARGPHRPWLLASSVGLRPSSTTASTTYRPSTTATPPLQRCSLCPETSVHYLAELAHHPGYSANVYAGIRGVPALKTSVPQLVPASHAWELPYYPAGA